MNWKPPLTILLLLSPACRDRVENSLPEPVAVAAEPVVAAASQYQLAKEIHDAERQPTEDDRALALSKIGDSWRGKRYSWTSFFVPAFCPSYERCHILPFDRGSRDSKIVQGWSPKIDIDQEEWLKLSESCKNQALCEIRFEGTLDKFTISTVDFTSLGFVDVQILASL